MSKMVLGHDDIMAAVERMKQNMVDDGYVRPIMYPVPRGGIPVAYLLMALCDDSFNAAICADPWGADVVIDDLIDSGATRARYSDKPFYAAFNKITDNAIRDRWIVFPWEVGDRDQSADDIVTRYIERIGDDVDREGLQETPARVLKAMDDWFAGYGMSPKDVLKTFEDGAPADKQRNMVVVSKIPVYSHCEHHIAPIIGTADVGYVPTGKIVGLSKIPRLVNVFARRLQVQERLTDQIADALDQHLAPLGVGVVIRARHMCMESRGVQLPGTITTTSAMRGLFFDDEKARAEFLRLAETGRGIGGPI